MFCERFSACSPLLMLSVFGDGLCVLQRRRRQAHHSERHVGGPAQRALNCGFARRLFAFGRLGQLGRERSHWLVRDTRIAFYAYEVLSLKVLK